MYKFSLILILLACKMPCTAQNLTGIWEGMFDKEQFLQINIMHSSKGICGYSYDTVIANKNDYCRAYFKGSYSKRTNEFYLQGLRFLENSGGHLLSTLYFNYFIENDKEYLIQEESLEEKRRKIEEGDTTKLIKLLRVSNTPSPYLKEVYKPCMEDSMPLLKKDTTPVKLISPSPIDSVTAEFKPKKKDTLVAPKKPLGEKKIEERSNKVIKTITLNSPTLLITMYDNAIVDGDTISVFHNGKLIVSRQLLSEKGIDITITLSKENPHHEIVLFAHNLGSIPPNTALLVITAGKERYELKASASLTENATLVFEYVPKE